MKPTVNLKCLVNNCFYVPLTSKNIIFSTCMLHAATPQNRHFQVMKPSQSVACVCGSLSFFVPLHFCLHLQSPLPPNSCSCCRLYEESNDCHTCHFIERTCGKGSSQAQNYPHLSEAEGKANKQQNKLDKTQREDTSQIGDLIVKNIL